MNMKRAKLAVLAAWMALGLPAFGEGETAGDFDYYVMALSWSPSWCEAEGDARQAAQCRDGAGFGWVLHGLWPQYEDGWPSYCPSGLRNPSRGETAAMADIMGSGGSAWHQWKKHGRCSGLTSEDYFDLARRAYRHTVRPPIFRKLPGTVRVRPDVIERAFLETNPPMQADGLTVECRDGRIAEVRICLTKDLEYRACAPDIRQDCRLKAATMAPVR